MESVMAMIQFVMSCILAGLAVVMLVGQSVMAGQWQWWMVPMGVLVLLSVALVRLSWKEYKQTLR